MAERCDDGEPRNKRKREDGDLERLLYELDQSEVLSDIGIISKILRKEKRYAVCALTIDHCNAAVGFGVPFRRAWCDTKVHLKEFYSFAYFFESGFAHLKNVSMKPRYIPDDENTRACLMKLLEFFSEDDSKNFILKLNKKADLLNNKTRLSVAVAEHLLRKLALKPDYILDDQSKKSAVDHECRCGCHTSVSDKFGNTSLGHPHVWYGNVDILVGNDLPVIVEGPDGPGANTPIDVTYNDTVEDINVKQQMIAKTIVYSFLQRKRRPDSQHFLIPCVGLSWQQIIFYFYDSQKDVLLQSSSIPLVSEGEINHAAIVALWLVLNYKHFGSGIPEDLNIPSSNFRQIARQEVDIYEEHLSFGDVWGRGFSMKFDPVAHLRAKFKYPLDT